MFTLFKYPESFALNISKDSLNSIRFNLSAHETYKLIYLFTRLELSIKLVN